MAGALLFLVAFIPGFPAIPFFTLSILLMASAYYVRQKHGHDLVESDLAASATTSGSKETAEHVVQKEDVPSLPDLLEVEVGYDLISIVDQKSGGEFPSRIVGIRKQLMNEMGVILPPVHIRDNLKLKASEYKIYLKGAVIAHGELIANHHLALDPGMTTRKIEGIATVDPTFGLPALWIPDVQKEAAIVAGYTVVDPASVLATHLMEIVRKNLHYLYGRQELSATLDRVKTTHPKIVTDLIPELLSLGIVLKVFQNLLHERVSVRDILTILETLAEYAPITKDPGDLTEYVRGALGRNISRQYIAADENLYAITLEKALEEKLTKSITHTQAGSTLSVDPQTAKHLVEQVGSEVKKNIANQHPPVVLTSQNVRPHLYKLIERFIPNLAVLAHGEVAGHVPVRPVGTINFSTAISSS